MATGSGRSLAGIDGDDLLRLARFADDVGAGLFSRHPQVRDVTLTGSCAGRYARGGLHYLNASNGIKNLDARSFYADRDDGPFP